MTLSFNLLLTAVTIGNSLLAEIGQPGRLQPPLTFVRRERRNMQIT
jgi:hypothetical protein